MTNLLCIMNAWTTFCGKTVRSSVWTLNAALPRWSEASSISLLSGILSCHQSIINQSVILWVWFIYNFFFVSTPKLCSNPEILLVFPKSYSFPFFYLIWFFCCSDSYQFTAQFLKCTFDFCDNQIYSSSSFPLKGYET